MSQLQTIGVSANEGLQDLQGYTIVKTLGQGNFGKVKLGIHEITGSEVAIKILQKQLIFQKTDIERISRQIKIMKLVKHPNIIQLYQIIETPKRLYLIMQYAKDGDLFDAIVSRQQLPEQSAQDYYAQLILGLEYLHSMGVTHRDLKPQNLLLSGQIIKICDFGLGSFFTDGQMLLTACGSPCYAPPQMLNKLPYDPKKVDLWSSGIILHAMVLGYLPFQDDITSKLYQKIKTQDFKLPFRLSIPCKSLIKSLLQKDPNQRISINEIKNQEWVKGSYEVYKESTNTFNQNLFKEVCEKYGIVEREKLLNYLKKNKHNNLTTLYYLGQKSLKKQKEQQQKLLFERKQLKENTSFKKLIDSDLTNLQNFDYSVHQQQQQIKQKLNQYIKQVIIKQDKPQFIITQTIKSNQQEQEKIIHKDQKQQYKKIQQPSKPIEQLKTKAKQQNNSANKPIQLVQPIAQSPKKSNVVKKNTKINTKIKNEESFEITKKYEKKISQINKNQPQKKLVRNQRMPIHNPHVNNQNNNKPPPPLYQHSQSKQKPLLLKKKIIAKTGIKELHLYDPKKIILCQIDEFITYLQKKGCNGRIEYSLIGNNTIYLIKTNITRQIITSTIKQINQKAKQ